MDKDYYDENKNMCEFASVIELIMIRNIDNSKELNNRKICYTGYGE